ncbi:hypothetical protein ACFQ9Z_38760 [Streptomyces sp. NPDC056580]|uniref:hypothetical protein n=1 Tax=Streptomyces sp. NPDC056580 TaxID=3345872 RepID=UPI00368D4E98
MPNHPLISTSTTPRQRDRPATVPARSTTRTLVAEARTANTLNLSEFLHRTGRDVTDVYRGASTWTTLLRRADLLPTPTTPTPGEGDLLKRMHSFLHVDDLERVTLYRQFTLQDAPAYDDLTEFDQTIARMLFFNLWDKAGGHASYTDGLVSLRGQHTVRAELGQLLTHLMHSDRIRPALPLTGAHAHIPLSIHHAYNRSEILAAMGVARLGGQLPCFFAQGVLWDPANKTDALLITLDKSERDFSRPCATRTTRSAGPVFTGSRRTPPPRLAHRTALPEARPTRLPRPAVHAGAQGHRPRQCDAVGAARPGQP